MITPTHYDIELTQGSTHVTSKGFKFVKGRKIRVAAGEPLAVYCKGQPRRFKLVAVDLDAERRRRIRAQAERDEAGSGPRKRKRTKSAPAPSVYVPTPDTRDELVAQFKRDSRADLKQRAEEFGLDVATGATKAALKDDIIKAFDARAADDDEGGEGDEDVDGDSGDDEPDTD